MNRQFDCLLPPQCKVNGLVHGSETHAGGNVRPQRLRDPGTTLTARAGPVEYVWNIWVSG